VANDSFLYANDGKFKSKNSKVNHESSIVNE